MSDSNEVKIARLEQRIAHLEADENRQRNWKMRIYGWIIGPAIMLFIGGLTIYGLVHFQVIPNIETLFEKVKAIGDELGRLHDKIESYHTK